MAHPNEALVRRGYEAFNKGDTQTLREVFDPEIVWHFPGRSVLAGDHRGTDALLGFFGRTMELTAGTFRVELHELVADDQHTVGLHLATGERRAGRLRIERSWCSTSATTRWSRRGSTSRTSTPIAKLKPAMKEALAPGGKSWFYSGAFDPGQPVADYLNADPAQAAGEARVSKSRGRARGRLHLPLSGRLG